MEVDSDDDTWRLNLNDAWTSDSEGEVRAKPSTSAAKFARAELDAVNVDIDAAPATATAPRGDINASKYALTLPNELGVLTVAQIHKCELGTVVWNAALILCDWLRANAGTLRGRTILEVGAGCGACGFYAAACGADCIIADCGPQTMRNLEKTLACYENLVAKRPGGGSFAGNVKLRRHLWEEDFEILEARRLGEIPGRVRHWSNVGVFENEGAGFAAPMAPTDVFDIVIGSDLLYFSSQEESLLAALRLRLKPGGVCYIVQTLRTNNAEVFARFVLAARRYFVVDIVSASLPNANVFLRAKETPHALLDDPYRLLTLRPL
jgi:predicted nicotinamide N-methyase